MESNGGVTGGFASFGPTWTCSGTSADRGTHLADYACATGQATTCRSPRNWRGSSVAAVKSTDRAGNQFTWEALLFTPV